MDIRRILAPVDLSESGLPALRYARAFADHLKAELTILYVDPVIYPINVLGEMPLALVASSPEHNARLRAEVEAHVEPVMNGRPYAIQVSAGQPALMIVAAATERNSDLIVMGTHARRGWRRTLVGSVAEDVLHSSPIPVLTVAKQELRALDIGETGITRIICPVNFTDVAADALRYAAGIAEVFASELVAVHVVEPGEVTGLAADQARVRQWIEPSLRDVWSYRELVVRGGPAERVLDCVDDLGCDLLVVGAQHKTFREATVIGTTSERLVRFAPCPVLVVTRPLPGELRQCHASDLSAARAVSGSNALP